MVLIINNLVFDTSCSKANPIAHIGSNRVGEEGLGGGRGQEKAIQINQFFLI